MNREGDHSMIDRHIYKEVETAIKSKPVTLITGARQVGKTSLALLLLKTITLITSLWIPIKTESWQETTPLCFFLSTPGP